VLYDLLSEVHVFTKDKFANTTSNKAAAIWLPYLAEPVDAVNRWSKESYFKYIEMSQDTDSGISIVDLKVLVNDEDVWWKNSLPSDALVPTDEQEIPSGFNFAYTIKSPLIETQIYLLYLAKQVVSIGGKIEFRMIYSLKDLTYGFDYVINCSGLGAIDLANDKSLYPIKGQLLKVKKQKNIKPTIADFAFDENGQNLAYTIPRQDYLILGGTAIKGDFSLTPNSELAKGIFQRCVEISDGKLEKDELMLLDVGLRPGRKVIRLEKDGDIIHNYGHGGSGYTVAWGCAEDVLSLIK
ncbi:MAG: FAD-dependent oxidoreductase, partial [Bacteroidota bacterium]